jgi:hypothetical protein
MLAVFLSGMRELLGTLVAGADDHLMKLFAAILIDEKLAQIGLSWRLQLPLPAHARHWARNHRLSRPIISTFFHFLRDNSMVHLSPADPLRGGPRRLKEAPLLPDSNSIRMW